MTTNLVWDNFQRGCDGNSDSDLLDAGDRVYANYNFDDPQGSSWNTISLSYDFNGNLIADGLFKYKYDAWNRLVGAWYHDGVMTAADERVITYEYDGLHRRIEKTVANKGWGAALAGGGDGDGAQDPPLPPPGDTHEHYLYSGWRLIETTDHAEDVNEDYDYAAAHVLQQFVWGTQYVDEPVAYDRNLDPATDDDCLEAGDARYTYHQDALSKTPGYGPKKGTSCANVSTSDVQDCLRACAAQYPSAQGQYGPTNTCQQFTPHCMSNCCMAQPQRSP